MPYHADLPPSHPFLPSPAAVLSVCSTCQQQQAAQPLGRARLGISYVQVGDEAAMLSHLHHLLSTLSPLPFVSSGNSMVSQAILRWWSINWDPHPMLHYKDWNRRGEPFCTWHCSFCYNVNLHFNSSLSPSYRRGSGASAQNERRG